MKIRESYGSRRYEEEYRAALEKSVHYFRQNSCITELRKMGYAQTKLQVEYEAEEYGKSEICCLDAETNTFFNSESAEKFIAENDLSKCENVNIYGDIRQIYCFGYDDKKVVYALTESDGMQNYITIPYISGENGEFCTDISSHRIWKREFSEKTSNLDCALRFRIAPDTWPNIKIKEADMSPDDIFAHAYEAIFNMEINSEKQVEIQLPYQKLCWNSEKKVLTCGKYQMEIKCDKKLSFVTIFDQYLTEIIADNKVLVLLNNLTNKAKEISVIDISGNLGKIRVGEDNDPHIQVETDKDTETEIVVYGLRGLAYSKDATEALRRKKKEDRLIFANDKFKVFDNHVEDSCYGRPDAYIISPEEIVSADRILEEFQWRKTKWGDMTRKSWRTDKWTADLSLKKYPTLKSASDILSATWNLAMTVFDRCTNGGYALPGQEHLWQAGLFQCKGEGFGVWLRDSVHIAMRGGNLIDPETAGRSLLYAVKKGFDNGSDGPAMGAVGLWDYYLATGDISALEEGYETLLETMTEIENRYNEEKGLVRAEQSTSNDAFPEPENAGYSLGSECYYMKAYDSMAKIEKLLHGENEKSKKWSKISEQLCEKIREEYWNDEAGYFTSGPKGSEAYENQIWETSGEEAALWDKFHIATPEQKREILNSGIHTAMTPYGIRLLPHRKEHNHFVGPVWPVWESGFASAAAESQNKELLLTMIAQQMRTAVLHKNFHEVLEADTGKSWRWPGQLWHACGFAAQILYGVFGISYDEQGMRFNPCVPEIFKEIEIQNLNYQSAKLTVKISGTGTVECVILDDEKVDFIPYSLTGNHIVHIKLTETESECI